MEGNINYAEWFERFWEQYRSMGTINRKRLY